MALHYITTTAEARLLQPVPLTEATDALLGQSMIDAEDMVDAYLKGHGATVPITGADITALLKIAVALMIAADLYLGAGQSKLAEEYGLKARNKLDEFLETVDLDIEAPISSPDSVNYQEQYINDWNEPNDSIENMDE